MTERLVVITNLTHTVGSPMAISFDAKSWDAKVEPYGTTSAPYIDLQLDTPFLEILSALAAAGKISVTIDSVVQSASDILTWRYAQATSPLADKGDLLTMSAAAETVLKVGTNGQVPMAASAEVTGIKWANPLRTVVAEFSLMEEVNATPKYFFVGRSASAAGLEEGRSCGSAGLNSALSVSPFQVPFDSTIVSAVVTVRGLGVNFAAAVYPVSIDLEAYSVGFAAEGTKLVDIASSVDDGHTVGGFTVGATNFSEAIVLDIDVDTGALVGLKFVPGAGASAAAIIKNCVVTLVLQERFV
jgi:hypothetical protein